MTTSTPNVRIKEMKTYANYANALGGFGALGAQLGNKEPSPFEHSVRAITADVAAMLIEKNAAYGNSALDPVRVFSKADPIEQLRVRIDDKISRIQRGTDAGEDTIMDLIGYLVLLKIALTKGN